jgi:hypothetical protein
MEPIYKIALQRDLTLSAHAEVELTSKIKSEPLLVVSVDPEDHAEIRRLQNEVRRFDDLVKWLRELLIAGPEAERLLSEMQMQEARGLIIDDETAEQLGLPTNGVNNDD